MLSREQRDELRRLAEAATPGPWDTDTHRDDDGREVPMLMQAYGINGHIAYGTGFGDGEQERINFGYLNAADPQTVLELLDELEAAEAQAGTLAEHTYRSARARDAAAYAERMAQE